MGIAGYLQASVQGQFVEDIASVFKRGRMASVSFGPRLFLTNQCRFCGNQDSEVIDVETPHLEGVPAIPATPRDREGFRESLR